MTEPYETHYDEDIYIPPEDADIPECDMLEEGESLKGNEDTDDGVQE